VALVTRPAHQAETLAHKIEAAGGHAVLWPALEIRPPRNALVLEHLAARMAHAEIVIFISPNAVEQAAAQVPAPTWPHHLLLAAVGAGTARALRARTGRHADLCPPEPYDSEGLLALPDLQSVAGRRILIVRGEGGRERLADTLRARGAAVEYAEVYRRACPEAAPAEARAALAGGKVDIVTATSVEALHNLVQMAGDLAERLRALPLVVVSERMRDEAQQLGFSMPVLTARAASDEALVETLLAWAGGRER
jgi:uroporphyrinogen-III synthase